MTTNAEKAQSLLSNVRALRPDPKHESNLGLKFYDEIGPPLTLDQAKKLHVHQVLLELNWNITHSAKVLAVNRITLIRMIKRWGLERT